MNNKPLYVIGDVHGCLGEMKDMLNILKNDVQEPSVLCFLGDYVDRGSNSSGVIEYLRKFKMDNIEPVFLKGNHEVMMLDALGPRANFSNVNLWYMNGGQETMDSYPNEKIPDKHFKFLNNLKLYYKHDFSDGPVVCVHAGIDPVLKNMDDQSQETLIWSRSYVTYNGLYSSADFVVFGHTPLKNIQFNRYSMGIDTACVFGNKLTMIKINDIGEKPVIFEVNKK